MTPAALRLDTTSDLFERVHGMRHLLRGFEHLHAEIGQAVTVGVALDERASDVALQCRQSSLHRGRIDLERPTRGQRAAVPRHSDEVLQVVPVEHGALCTIAAPFCKSAACGPWSAGIGSLPHHSRAAHDDTLSVLFSMPPAALMLMGCGGCDLEPRLPCANLRDARAAAHSLHRSRPAACPTSWRGLRRRTHRHLRPAGGDRQPARRVGADRGAGAQVGAADGATWLLAQGALASLYPTLYEKLGYDPARDLRSVSIAAEMNLGVAVGPAVPADVTGMRALVDWMRSHPASANAASPGAGTLPHILETWSSTNPA
jgi:hypothetical protein